MACWVELQGLLCARPEERDLMRIHLTLAGVRTSKRRRRAIDFILDQGVRLFETEDAKVYMGVAEPRRDFSHLSWRAMALPSLLSKLGERLEELDVVE